MQTCLLPPPLPSILPLEHAEPNRLLRHYHDPGAHVLLAVVADDSLTQMLYNPCCGVALCVRQYDASPKGEIMVAKTNALSSRNRAKDPKAFSAPEDRIDYPEIFGKKFVNEPMEFINAIRSGLPGNSVNAISELLQVSKGEMYSLLHITPRTAQRIIRSERLDVDKSDHLVQLMKTHRRCMEVFEDGEKALRWLKTPNFALGDQTPLSLLDTSEGIELVGDTLSRIEYGVFG